MTSETKTYRSLSLSLPLNSSFRISQPFVNSPLSLPHFPKQTHRRDPRCPFRRSLRRARVFDELFKCMMHCYSINQFFGSANLPVLAIIHPFNSDIYHLHNFYCAENLLRTIFVISETEETRLLLSLLLRTFKVHFSVTCRSLSLLLA